MKELGRGLLAHELRIGQHQELQPIRHPRIALRPGNQLLSTTMGGTVDLSGKIVEKYRAPGHLRQTARVGVPARVSHGPGTCYGQSG